MEAPYVLKKLSNLVIMVIFISKNKKNVFKFVEMEKILVTFNAMMEIKFKVTVVQKHVRLNRGSVVKL
jgi:hypothetical protein